MEANKEVMEKKVAKEIETKLVKAVVENRGVMEKKVLK